MWRFSFGTPSYAVSVHTVLPVARSSAITTHLLRRAVLGGRAVAVEARLERDVGAAADRARHEDPVAPDDRARVRQAGDGDLPADVRAADAVPRVGQTLAVGDAGRRRAAEPGPVVAGGREGAVRRTRRRCTRRTPRGTSSGHSGQSDEDGDADEGRSRA